jgi:predicted GIY-YIG superfamily endonuclease
MYYVYFLKSLKNDKIYCGMTNKLPGGEIERS